MLADGQDEQDGAWGRVVKTGIVMSVLEVASSGTFRRSQLAKVIGM